MIERLAKGLLAVVCAASLATSASAALNPDQQAKVDTAQSALEQVGRLVLTGQHEQAGPLVLEAEKLLTELSGQGVEAKRLAEQLKLRVAAGRRLLQARGISLPDSPGAPAGGVAFTRDVAPILVARCNNCHITGNRGDFSMATFASLMKGSPAGTVIFPGNSQGSRLMEVLASGDMPRGGARLSDEQLQTIARWIDAGAKFDGTDANAPLAASATPAAPASLQVMAATGNETIRFSRDIAPVLAAQCIDCHGGAQPAAQLGLDTFARLLAGSQNGGPVISPGKPGDSLLIRKIKGLEGERMPRGRPPLDDQTIARFEKWVAEGARFDAPDANQPVEMVARIYQASQMSHDELAAERARLAQANWKLAIPDERPEQVESESFLVLGNVGEEELRRVLTAAEAQQVKVARLLRAPSGAPLVKGKITLFSFKKRYDYSEFGTMVEKRTLPDDQQGHWRYNVIDAYGCIVLSGDQSLEGLVAQQIAGVYVESLGLVPASGRGGYS